MDSMATQHLTRRILRLAVPALGALVAQPLFVATDTAMVGHLGEPVLAGLAVGSTVVSTLVGLMVFLAYTTTPIVARRLGAGDRPGAIRAGIDGMWLGLACGVVLLLVGLPLSAPIVAGFTRDAIVGSAAMSYLTISLWGLPAMLLTLAATGLLRGLQDTRTPLVVAVAGAGANVVLNAVFIYGLGLGIAGSALGTVVAEWGMALVYLLIAARAARAHGVTLRPGIGDPRQAITTSALMMLRTVTLRIALIVLVWASGQLGVSELATLQVTYTVYNVLVFVLDALAIAAQAMVGHDLGVGDRAAVRRMTTLLAWWGVGLGVALGVVIAATSGVLGHVFTTDARVLELLPGALVTMAITLPVCGYVFSLDGILIGAGDIAYLAWTGLINLAVFCALAWAVLAAAPAETGLVWLWAAFGGGFMLSRGVTLGVRVANDRWMVVGASR
jgi:putative MATE family efflux protein